MGRPYDNPASNERAAGRTTLSCRDEACLIHPTFIFNASQSLAPRGIFPR